MGQNTTGGLWGLTVGATGLEVFLLSRWVRYTHTLSLYIYIYMLIYTLSLYIYIYRYYIHNQIDFTHIYIYMYCNYLLLYNVYFI